MGGTCRKTVARTYTSGRAVELYGDSPPKWDFAAHPAADIVVVNLGTNDANVANNVTTDMFVAQYTQLIEGVHTVWPKAQVILIVSCNSTSRPAASGV